VLIRGILFFKQTASLTDRHHEQQSPAQAKQIEQHGLRRHPEKNLQAWCSLQAEEETNPSRGEANQGRSKRARRPPPSWAADYPAGRHPGEQPETALEGVGRSQESLGYVFWTGRHAGWQGG